MPDPKPHAKRLVAMLDQERQWVLEAKSSDLYDVILDSFDETNAQAIVKFVLNLSKKEALA